MATENKHDISAHEQGGACPACDAVDFSIRDHWVKRLALIAELTGPLTNEELKAVKDAGGIKVILTQLPVGW
jgi:hypothetical protein